MLRLMALYSLGFTYSLESDDVSYIEVGSGSPGQDHNNA